MKPSEILLNLWNVDSKQSEINEAAIKVIFIVKKKISNSLYNEAEIYFWTIFYILKPRTLMQKKVRDHHASLFVLANTNHLI